MTLLPGGRNSELRPGIGFEPQGRRRRFHALPHGGGSGQPPEARKAAPSFFFPGEDTEVQRAELAHRVTRLASGKPGPYLRAPGRGTPASHRSGRQGSPVGGLVGGTGPQAQDCKRTRLTVPCHLV